MSANGWLTRLVGTVVVFLLFAANRADASAADLKVEAILVWGTDEAKSPNPKHKPVDPALAKKLRKVFKWHNYFEVNKQTADIPLNQTSKIKMSSKCDLEVKNLGKSRVEVMLIGVGKVVGKNVQTLTPGEDLIMAGDEKNNTAWFVVIRAADPK